MTYRCYLALMLSCDQSSFTRFVSRASSFAFGLVTYDVLSDDVRGFLVCRLLRMLIISLDRLHATHRLVYR